jgi:hypothetical protein
MMHGKHEEEEEEMEIEMYWKKGVLEKEKCALGCYKVKYFGTKFDSYKVMYFGKEGIMVLLRLFYYMLQM